MKVKIERLDHFGRGITTINNKICFVENALPEEIVEIEIIKEYSKYIEAKVKNYIELSFNRIQEECPYQKECGGCDLNHMEYDLENKWKEEKIKSLLKKIVEEDKIDKISYLNRNYYRNKITLHGNKKELGLYKKNTKDVVSIKECRLCNNKINEIINLLEKDNNKKEEALIRTSNDNKEVMLSITGDCNNIEEIKKNCTVLRINNNYETKETSIKTTIGEKSYYISLDSFFQINNSLTKNLYDEVLNNIKGKNYNTVLDLYCGTGTIGIYISEEVKTVIGIDYNESNIEDANKNKELNKCNNIEFICNKVENEIQNFKDIDCIIVDPPRKGLDQKTKEIIKRINPKSIIYVSCDIMTLKRDLEELTESYNIIKVKPFNMFPRTYHVESVSVLERKNVEK